MPNDELPARANVQLRFRPSNENFTTEALAAVVRLDPAPLLQALRTSDGFESIHTQVGVKECGILDIVLRLCGELSTVWIEVKVNAGFSGDNQPQKYLDAAYNMPAPKPRVLLLAPSDLEGRPGGVEFLAWQAIYDAAKGNPLWTDFRDYLKELRMADDSLEPVTVEESSTLAGAHALLEKVVRILEPAAARANTVWPGSCWPTDRHAIRKMIGKRFAVRGNFTIEHQAGFRCGVTMGVCHRDGAASLAIWVWAPPRLAQERDRIGKLAAQHRLLGGAWTKDPASWELFAAYQPLTAFANHEQASGWLKERLDELKGAALLDLISGTGKPEPDQDDGPAP